MDFDLNDLELTFTIDNSAASPSQLSNPAKKAVVTTLLDITRANNVAIMLSRVKMDLPDIRKALLEINDSKLSVDDLRAIAKQLPSQEEITRIKDFGDVSKLAKADQYFAQVSTSHSPSVVAHSIQLASVPRLPERLECMLYRRKLDLDIAELRPDLNTLHNASLELRNSTKLKHVLKVVLAVGNALNGSSFRGGASGFQLDALLKVTHLSS